MVTAQTNIVDVIFSISRVVENTAQINKTKETYVTHKKECGTEVADLNDSVSREILLKRNAAGSWHMLWIVAYFSSDNKTSTQGYLYGFQGL